MNSKQLSAVLALSIMLVLCAVDSQAAFVGDVKSNEVIDCPPWPAPDPGPCPIPYPRPRPCPHPDPDPMPDPGPWLNSGLCPDGGPQVEGEYGWLRSAEYSEIVLCENSAVPGPDFSSDPRKEPSPPPPPPIESSIKSNGVDVKIPVNNDSNIRIETRGSNFTKPDRIDVKFETKF